MADSVHCTITDGIGSYLQLGGLSLSNFNQAYVAMQVYVPTATMTAWLSGAFPDSPLLLYLRKSAGAFLDSVNFRDTNADAVYDVYDEYYIGYLPGDTSGGTWHKLEWLRKTTSGPGPLTLKVDGVTVGTSTFAPSGTIQSVIFGGFQNHFSAPATGDIYIARIKVGTSEGASDAFYFDAATAANLAAFTVVGTCVLGTAPSPPPTWSGMAPSADVFYTARGGSVGPVTDLYTVDPETAAVTSIGSIGGGRTLTGLAIDPTDGTLYGITPNSGGDFASLLTIDISTGASTLIGGFAPKQCGDIAFDSAGNLYAFDIADHRLATLNKSTAVLTSLGPTGIAGSTWGFGLAIDSGDVCYLFPKGPRGNYYTLNLATGAATLVGVLDGVGTAAAVAAAAFDSSDVCWILDSGFGGSVSELLTVDLGTGAKTALGTFSTFGGQWDALVVQGAAPPPGIPPVPTVGVGAAATVVLTFDQPLDPASVPDPTQFDVKLDGVSKPVDSVSISGIDVSLVMVDSIPLGAVVTVDYTYP